MQELSDEILKDRVVRLEENIAYLLDQTAKSGSPCQKCGVQLWFLENHLTGKLKPFTHDGTLHLHATSIPRETYFKSKA